MKTWIRVTRRSHCPICEKDSWCSVSADLDQAVCMRVESPKPCKSGGWYHDLIEPGIQGRRVSFTPVAVPDRLDSPTLTALACKYVDQATSLKSLSDLLGVSVSALERLDVGYDHGNWTFPMRNAHEEIVGIRIRGPISKWSVAGGTNGLFWPRGVDIKDVVTLLLPEGPTDCAVLLDLGYASIGRPGCQGCEDMICDLVGRYRRHVVVVADNDKPKPLPGGKSFRPGQDGAMKLANAIRPFCSSVKIIKPIYHKDLRQWRPTRSAIDKLIHHARFV